MVTRRQFLGRAGTLRAAGLATFNPGGLARLLSRS
jgi:hypothetical protein